MLFCYLLYAILYNLPLPSCAGLGFLHLLNLSLLLQDYKHNQGRYPYFHQVPTRSILLFWGCLRHLFWMLFCYPLFSILYSLPLPSCEGLGFPHLWTLCQNQKLQHDLSNVPNHCLCTWWWAWLRHNRRLCNRLSLSWFLEWESGSLLGCPLLLLFLLLCLDYPQYA